MKWIGSGLAVVMMLGSAPAQAQADVETRVERIEKQLRAVQRKVFPGGAGQYFEPEITAPTTGSTTTAGSTSAVTDLIARVDALEGQLANLTGMVEQNGFKLKNLEDRLLALETPIPDTTETVAAPAASGSSSSTASSAPPALKPTAERIEGVSAIEKPETGDAGEDSYIYGYRLWSAGFYPEAQTQLEQTVKDYPSHRRASFAQNLLGRAYLDEGKPATATRIFLDSYQKMPRGERAPDSLYFLGRALTELKENDRACRAFEELESSYPADASGRLSNDIASGKSAAGCS